MFSDAPAQNRQLMIVLPTVLTVIVLMKMSAGVAPCWGMSNAFGAAQGYIGQRFRTS
jgi:membrane protein insertase Oxa1/YidC/SpoIIIJ